MENKGHTMYSEQFPWYLDYLDLEVMWWSLCFLQNILFANAN